MLIKNKITSCIICDREFEKKSHNMLYCSKECKKVIKKENNKKYRLNNKDRAKDYTEINKERIKKQTKIRDKKRYLSNKECIKEKCNNYRRNNIELIRIKQREYYAKNSYKIINRNITYNRTYKKSKYSIDTNYRLICILRTCFRKILKENKTDNHLKDYINYTPQELKLYLESLWLEGMSWNNYGLYGWHIDHKRPLSSFNFINEDKINKLEIKEALRLENLQPLWAKDNLSKGAKYESN